jgi:serine/threonine protein kinase
VTLECVSSVSPDPLLSSLFVILNISSQATTILVGYGLLTPKLYDILTPEQVIGEGSYGKVRIGTHRLTGTRVALKQIPKSVSAQLTREIHHHRQLHHPHVVQLYEVIATETSIWLVTELCAGGELFDYLVEQGRIDELEARTLFGQLCLAVAYCHDQGVVHRDLKLENVLLDDHCQVKLSDFGFTREFERGTLMDTFCGTTGYASPEMLMGQKYLGQGLCYPPYPTLALTKRSQRSIFGPLVLFYMHS